MNLQVTVDEFERRALERGRVEGHREGHREGRKEGQEEGLRKGEVIGQILALREILEQTPSNDASLRTLSLDELQQMLTDLKARLRA